MNAVLKAKFLQHLSKKKSDQGFTLVELLVVIIIVGILSAIALPSFLNQAAKARQTEAQQNISSINTSQRAFRDTDGGGQNFATNFDQLAMGLQSATATATTNDYQYTITGGAGITAAAQAQPRGTNTKGYASLVHEFVNSEGNPVYEEEVCEATQAGTAFTFGIPEPVAPGTVGGISCGTGTVELK